MNALANRNALARAGVPLDGAGVAQFRRDMDKAGTARNARKAMARLALGPHGNLTACGRIEWEKELAQ